MTKTEYLKKRKEYSLFLNAKRCATCAELLGDMCGQFKEQVPADYIYQVTDCNKWMDDVPF